MARKGIADYEQATAQFDICGQGDSGAFCDYVMLNANERELGVVNDDNLHQLNLGGVCGFDGSPNADYGSAVHAFLAEGIEPGRRPTSFWEFGHLGLFQSRSRCLDPEPNALLAQHRIFLAPYNDEPAVNWWPGTITQEVANQYTASIGSLWGEGS